MNAFAERFRVKPGSKPKLTDISAGFKEESVDKTAAEVEIAARRGQAAPVAISTVR